MHTYIRLHTHCIGRTSQVENHNVTTTHIHTQIHTPIHIHSSTHTGTHFISQCKYLTTKPKRSSKPSIAAELQSQQNKLKAIKESQKERKKKREESLLPTSQLQSTLPPTYSIPPPPLHTALHLEGNSMKWHYAYENVQKDGWFMYALDANSITGHKAVVRFLSEHLAALIKPISLIQTRVER